MAPIPSIGRARSSSTTLSIGTLWTARLVLLRSHSRRLLQEHYSHVRGPRQKAAIRRWRHGLLTGHIAGAFAWMAAVRLLDDLVDGDDTHTTLRPEQHLDHMNLLLATLAGEKDAWNLEATTPDVLLITAIRHAERAGRAIVPLLREDIWPGYEADARRQFRGEVFPSAEVYAASTRANLGIWAIYAHILGAPYQAVYECFRPLGDSLVFASDLLKLPREIAACQAHVPREWLEDAGVDVSQVARCRTWRDLSRTPNMTRFFTTRVEAATALWRASGRDDFLRAWNLVPGIIGRVFRALIIRPWLVQHDLFFVEIRETVDKMIAGSQQRRLVV